MLEEERTKYERGRKYLARMMGQDPATFDQSHIDEAVRYFFPSALGSMRARPKLKVRCPPIVYPPFSLQRKYIHKRKVHCIIVKFTLAEIQFDKTGRPFHDLYYTGKPAFYELMHYENWLNIMEALVKHPLSWHAEEFIMSYRVSVQADTTKEVFPEASFLLFSTATLNLVKSANYQPLCFKLISSFTHDDSKPQLDPDLNQKFVDTFGQKKHAFAEVRLFHPGTGKFTVNEKRLLEFFPELGNREQLMFPLQLTGMLGTVDVTAKIADTETGSSSKANALRLAISRALACFLPGDLGANRLRAAGLLTQDDRFSERKKPGQKKALAREVCHRSPEKSITLLSSLLSGSYEMKRKEILC
ncbi:unnamed protein product [Schistocephalus solidus]|uniref:Cilia- and flagella-associated protein 299 n=1 Tax=Schistocephalus solidus TaxID=70667 RepID=A0A183SR10_SCHSO|nr:unnamed protein product [Schistocephalus solidus]